MQTDSARLRHITAGLADVLRPPRRMRVTEAAALHLHATETQKWDAETVPYMLRPMDETASRLHDLVCFVGPARTGKTFGLVLGRWVYTVVCHPLDFAVIHSSQDLARDLSIRDLARQHKYSDGLREAMTGRASDSNTYDKIYKSGIMAVIGWPSNKQLASRTIPVMLLTDYGRWPADIGGEGSGLDQARKRTETAGSLAMTVVESSPGCEIHPDADIEPPRYELGKPLVHAFPATESGVRADICPVYNNGTREWWYVPCQSCGEYYPQGPTLDRFSWGASDDPIIAAESAGTVCCWCGAVHGEDTKRVENANGVWLAEGQVIDCHGHITGDSRLGKTYPSFALGGGAAAYQTRKSIVVKYLQALATAKTTGDESSIKAVVNADIGGPHTPLHITGARAATPIQKRAESVKKLAVPAGVRFIGAAVDVQKNRFVVQIMGYGPDRNRWVIDRYSISKSERTDEDGNRLPTDPASYLEDWSLLTPLINKRYPVAEKPGGYMQVAFVLCDSGGGAGVTDQAYAYYRSLSAEDKRKFRLVKGANNIDAPLIEQRWPDTRNRKDIKGGGSKGDVPILFINTHRIKDRLDGDLSRTDPGPGYCHFPDWLGDWFYKELTREKRTAKGWTNPAKNEAWDLMVYGEVGAISGIPFGPSYRQRGIDKPGFWQHPPPWAQINNNNPLITADDTAPPDKPIITHVRPRGRHVRGR